MDQAIALDRALLADPALVQLPDAGEITDVLRHNLAYALLHSNGFAEAESPDPPGARFRNRAPWR